MSKWKTYKLGEIYDFASGLSKGKEFFGRGYPFVTFKDVFQNYFLPKNLTALVETNEKERDSCSVKEGDVFLTRTSENDTELGLSSVALKDYPNATFNGFTKRLRPKGNIEIIPEFVGFYFRSPKFRTRLSQFATMTTRASLNNEILANLTIDLPHEKTQRQIGNILKSLDDKIELNLQMNQTLEAMAQAIFKEWFVHFNFPGFDGELVGALPKGWKMGELNEVCKIEIGRTPPRMEERWFSTNPKDIKWISIRDLGLAGVYIFNTSEYLTQEAVEKFHIPIIPENTVVLSFKLTIGRLAITTETMLSNEAIAQIKSDVFSTEYIYTYLKTYNWGTLGSTSSIATAINSKIIKEMEILIPETKVEKQFQEVIKPIFEKLKANSQEIETLLIGA